MNKKIIGLLVVVVLVTSVGFIFASKSGLLDSNVVKNGLGKSSCTAIKDGALYGSDGDLLVLGYNEWGYNYQAHMFNGMWCDYHPTYRPGGANHDWCMENMANVELMMKWSDEWLANTDCNGDLRLDRGYSCNPNNPVNSGCYGAWLTNHERGIYEQDGEICKYESFVKIVAVPEDAYKSESVWYTVDGVEIGPVIWGAFATIQEFTNDPCEGGHEVAYKSMSPAGLGFYT